MKILDKIFKLHENSSKKDNENIISRAKSEKKVTLNTYIPEDKFVNEKEACCVNKVDTGDNEKKEGELLNTDFRERPLPQTLKNLSLKGECEIREYNIKKHVCLCCIAIRKDLINLNEILNGIKKLGNDKLIKLFVFSRGYFKTSGYMYSSDVRFEEDVLTSLCNIEGDHRQSDLECKSLFYKIISDIDMETTGKIQNLGLVNYEVDSLRVIFYGSYDFKDEEIFNEEILLKICSIRNKAETTYYMTKDDTITLSALGFRNLYLLDRFNYEGVR